MGNRIAGLALAALVLVSATSCRDATGITDLAGNYVATTMTLTTSGESYDLLDIGEELHLTINSDGSHSGVLHNVLDDVVADLSLPGFVVRRGDNLLFYSDASDGNILTDHLWTVVGSTLVGKVVDGDYSTRIILTRE
jgi:hypothetical protein